MTIRRTLLLLLASVILSVATPVSALDTPRSVTANIYAAGQLRTQSQRLAKLWLQIGLGINADDAASQLARGVAQVDATMADLSRNARDAGLQRRLHRAGELWEDFRKVLGTRYSPQNLKRVTYLADDLMLATGKLAMQFETEADSAAGRLLDLSLRQNMLAQRLARLYLMAQAGDRSRGRLVDIDQVRREFSMALTELAVAPENTPASRDALALARVQWMFFENAVADMSNGGDSRPQHVATTSERILEVLDGVSQQYATDYNTSRLLASGGTVRRN